MKDTFSNLIELISQFNDEQKCREYLAQSRWNGKPICPYCSHDKVYNIENGKRYKCANPECHKKFSVTVGTIFEDTNLPLTKWFPAVYLITNHKKGISSLQLGRDLGITQKSAWFVLHRVREMLKEKNPVMLKGTVEADETYVGGKDKNRHYNKRKHITGIYTKTAMLGLVEKGGKVFATRINGSKIGDIAPVVVKHVEFGSTLHTDEHGAYKAVGKKHYNHKFVSHQIGIYVDGDVTTNTIEGFWSLLKRGILGIYHYASEKHINRYLDEFCARYNTRTLGEGERFDLYLGQCADRRLTYANLTK